MKKFKGEKKTGQHFSLVAEEISRTCTKCGLCKEECLFLKTFQIEPKEFAESLTEKSADNLDLSLIFACNLCGTCEEVCPEGISLKDLFLLLRQERLKKEKEHFPAFAWIKERMAWISKGGFLYPQSAKCETVFFPGCNLPGYNPQLVLETYWYLKKQHNPSTGIILNCCGAPFEGLGASIDLRDTLQSISFQIEKTGASLIIMACPTCYRIFREYFPQYTLTTVYEIMGKEGLPKVKKNSKEKFFLFHPCATKNEKEIQHAVRNLIETMGYSVSENNGQKTRINCCGVGGMVGITNPVMASIIGAERTEGISNSIVTYCASCREALVQYRPSLHILDLIFNPNWRQDQEKPSQEHSQMRENFAWLIRQLRKG